MLFLITSLFLLNGYRESSAEKTALPVLNPDKAGYAEMPYYRINNLISLKQLYATIQNSGGDELSLDFSQITRLLDGTKLNPRKLYGTACFGPYPFECKETQYAYKRLRKCNNIKKGRGKLSLAKLLKPVINSEDWVNQGQVVIRFQLFLSKKNRDRNLGAYDIFLRFIKKGKTLFRAPTITEGPFISLSSSESPGACVIHFHTDTPVTSSVLLNTGASFRPKYQTRKHVITLSGLNPSTEYSYRVFLNKSPVTAPVSFKTPPVKGAGTVKFAFAGDSREGIGGGDRNFMGVNHKTLTQLMALAFFKSTEFTLFGGDLISGYTSSEEDFIMQFFSWKQAVAGYWRSRPVYAAMGNHEGLLNVWDNNTTAGIRLDKWPYETRSAEALFSSSFTLPDNGPEPADNRRPEYRENVYSFHYGPVKIICFNNNYWYSSHPSQYGGSPEGYIMDDQLNWIASEIAQGDKDSTVKHIILFAQEPILPCGGHVSDAMWYNGDNAIRAFSLSDSAKLMPSEKGIIEARNQFIRAAASSSKVAAVLGSDEHAYHRVFINRNVPIGDPQHDDLDSDNLICETQEPCSPLKDLKHGVWYITSGGGGAPYYSEQSTPWNSFWKTRKNTKNGYFYSSQENILLFQSSDSGLAVEAVNPFSEKIDGIVDLMANK